MFTEPKESKEFPGFYHINGVDGFVISRAGLIINCFQHWFVPRIKDPAGYWTANVGYGRAKSKYERVHILVARTFIPRPSDDPTLQVNHINGDKTDAHVENLEWVTPKENTWHAGRTGLSDKCLPLQVRNSSTGEIKEYPSVLEYSRQTDLSVFNVRYWIKHGDGGKRIFDNGMQYRISSADPWPKDSYKQNLLHPKTVDIKDIRTGIEQQFSSIMHAADFIGIDSHTLAIHLKAGFQSVFYPGYQVKFSSDSKWRELRDPIIEVCDTLLTRPVQMYNPLTSETRVFASKVACERLTGIDANKLINRLRTKPGSARRSCLSDPNIYGYYPMFSDQSIPLERLEL